MGGKKQQQLFFFLIWMLHGSTKIRRPGCRPSVSYKYQTKIAMPTRIAVKRQTASEAHCPCGKSKQPTRETREVGKGRGSLTEKAASNSGENLVVPRDQGT